MVDEQDADESESDAGDRDEPVQLRVTRDSGPAFEVDDATWVARESTAVSYWGHNFGGG